MPSRYNPMPEKFFLSFFEKEERSEHEKESSIYLKLA
jgi:hypothetical protein